MTTARSRAPGRVELLGNHTDYNEGVVLSAAINYTVKAEGELSGDDSIHLRSDSFAQEVSVPLDRVVPEAGEQSWVNYPLGVVDALRQEGFEVGGFRMQVTSDLPPGAGLSSSAALEVATAYLLKSLFSLDLPPMQAARLCRRAENEFVGVKCGLLDQVSSIFGRVGQAVHLDCRSEQVENIPLPADAALLVFQCGVPHRLVGGEYNERREQCFAAAAALGVRALRDVDSTRLEAAHSALDDLVYRRALHIVGENERVMAGIEHLRRGNAAAFGALMFASHESSRVNFENSTPELDTLVKLARTEPGVLGSRLTGGGFGGATISLVERARAEEIARSLDRRYHERTGHQGQAFICESADGAS